MTMVNMMIQMPKELADYVSQNGIAEIVMRQQKAKIKAMIKTKVLNNGLNEKEAQKAMNAVGKMMQSSLKAKDVNGALHAAGNLMNMTDNMRNMAGQVDTIFNGMKVIQGLQYLNVGMDVANLAVNVAGLVIICNKLNEIRGEVSALSKKITDMKLGDIQEQYLKFSGYFEIVSRKLEDGDEINYDELDTQLHDIMAYLSKLTLYYENNTLSSEELLNLMSALLPMYTALLNIFLINFYFEKEKLPTNFDSYTSIYDKLSSPTFGKLTFDYCFLEKNMSSIDARDATNATLLLTINNFSQIVDQVTILKELKTKENFEMYTNALNENARTQVNQILAMS